MSNALAWARQYIAVPDAMYREYVEELLRMAERAESLESAVKLVDVIEPGFAMAANAAHYQYSWPMPVEEAIVAIKKLKAVRNHPEGMLR